MARQTVSPVADLCADCGAAEPSWTSINRGILLCHDCCSVHRGLGRQISIIKSLDRSDWAPSQLQMVRDLYSNGSNSIWEHTLLDPLTGKSGGRKKPVAKDPLHPNKSDFIRAKHANLSFINKSSKEESESEISEQLHSSVRTPNLKTSLRLLAAGANPNYIHPEKFNSPLHSAAKSGQMSQIELLIVYGANPLVLDAKGKTPIDYAKEANFNEIADRLVECQYELSDRLTHFLCRKKPNHKRGQHYLIPELAENQNDLEQATEARLKLQSLSNHLFEEIARDVYDEIDRRELEVVCSELQGSTFHFDKYSVPFLPVSHEFSATRNQGRQKLARLNTREFSTLIVDILNETRRRVGGVVSKVDTQKPQVTMKKPLKKQTESSDSECDSEPLYDSVPSEDEEFFESQSVFTRENNEKFKDSKNTSQMQKRTSQVTDAKPNSYSSTEYCTFKDQLTRSDALIQELVLSNKDMRHEITRLQIMVQKLIDENAQLRAVVMPKNNDQTVNTSANNSAPPAVLPRTFINNSNRPQSMYERPSPATQTTASSNSMASLNTIVTSTSSQAVNDHPSQVTNSKSQFEFLSVTRSKVPRKEEVMEKTDDIRKCIQELLNFAQEGSHQMFDLCSDKISLAVAEMINLFPESVLGMSSVSDGDKIFSALKQLHTSALKLRIDCRSFNSTVISKPETQDYRVLYQQVIQRAYDIAKAVKLLVTLFQ